jgi:hypothetical protein
MLLRSFCHWLITAFIFGTGLWLDPLAPLGAGNFIRHTAIYHAGALIFLFGDIFLLFGAGTLTVMQAMQVRGLLLLMSIHGSYNAQTRFIAVLVILEMPTVGWDLTEIGCHLHFEHMSFWDSCYNDI